MGYTGMRQGLSLVILAASSTLSFAADLSPATVPVKAVADPAFTWTGVYIGGTAGYGFDNEHAFNTRGNDEHTQAAILAGSHARSMTLGSDGFTGGGEVGVDYQFAHSALFGTGGVVIGLEADLQYIGPGTSAIHKAPGRSPTEFFSSKTNYLGTVRGRLGYAFNTWLIYGTGGWAYGEIEDGYDILSPSGLSSTNSRTTVGTGYAVGGGLAYAIPTHVPVGAFRWSAAVLKAEYLYYDLGSSDMYVQAPNPARSFTSNIGAGGNLVRVGLDFKFN